MTDLLDLYKLAEAHGTQVYWFDLGAAESLSMPLPDGSCAVAMDPSDRDDKEYRHRRTD